MKSFGQPWIYKPYVAGSLTWNREGEERVGGIGSSGNEAGGWDGGARVFATSRLLFLNVGLDWNARTAKTEFVLAFNTYFNRGGLGGSRRPWRPQIDFPQANQRSDDSRHSPGLGLTEGPPSTP